MPITASIAALVALACHDIAGLSPLDRRTELGGVGPTVVSPANMRGWAFSDDQAGVACADSTLCRMVSGPAAPPAGTGSGELATTTAADGKALLLPGYLGTRFDNITELRYATYRQTADAGNNLAIALQFNVDYDLVDQATGWQGRVVFEPHHGNGGSVVQNRWQTWDAKAGRWWGTKASVPAGGILVANPCVQASPCTWAQLVATFPNVGVHATYGAVILKAGSGWAAFRGNVDALVIGVGGTGTTYDFELYATPRVGIIPPDSLPRALFDSLGFVSGSPLSEKRYRKDIITVAFEFDTPLAARQAAIDSVGGIVVGGKRYFERQDGEGIYYIRIQGGTTAALLAAVRTLHRQPQVAVAAWWEMEPDDERAHRRPFDGVDWRDWTLDPNALNPARQNRALEYVRAPSAWGCSVGSASTVVAVVDEYVNKNGNTPVS